jgi:exosortase/archaeosortase family protein
MPSEARLKLLLRRQRDGIRFCILFALYTVLVFAVLYAARTALGLFGAHTASSGAVVTRAAYEIGLYTAAVWAYPVSLRDRLIATLLGAAVLYGVNFLRILTLLALGLLQPAWFESTHLYGWQALFLLVVSGCWLAWVSRVRPVA